MPARGTEKLPGPRGVGHEGSKPAAAAALLPRPLRGGRSSSSRPPEDADRRRRKVARVDRGRGRDDVEEREGRVADAAADLV